MADDPYDPLNPALGLGQLSQHHHRNRDYNKAPQGSAPSLPGDFPAPPANAPRFFPKMRVSPTARHPPPPATSSNLSIQPSHFSSVTATQPALYNFETSVEAPHSSASTIPDPELAMGEGQPRKRLRFADDDDVDPTLRHFRRYSDNPAILETSPKSPPESSGPAGVAPTSPSLKRSEADVGVTHPRFTASLSHEEPSVAATRHPVGKQTIPAMKSKPLPLSSKASIPAEPKALASPRLAPPESGGTQPIRRESMTSNQIATSKAAGGKTTSGVKLAPTPSPGASQPSSSASMPPRSLGEQSKTTINAPPRLDLNRTKGQYSLGISLSHSTSTATSTATPTSAQSEAKTALTDVPTSSSLHYPALDLAFRTPWPEAGVRGASGAPMVKINPVKPSGKVPPHDRNVMLDHLYQHFNKAYAGLLQCLKRADVDEKVEEVIRSAVLEIAAGHARRQEAGDYHISHAGTYKSTARAPLAELSKRARDPKAIGELNQVGSKALKVIKKAAKNSRQSADYDWTAAARAEAISIILTSEHVGLNKELGERKEVMEKREKGRLSLQRLEAYALVAPPHKLCQPEFGFPVPAGFDTAEGDPTDKVIKEAWGANPETAADHEASGREDKQGPEIRFNERLGTQAEISAKGIGTTRECIRCGQHFKVRALIREESMWASKSKKLEESSGTDQSGSQSLAMLLEDAREELKACSYHWGKKSYESEPGHGSRRAGRIVRYTCCDATEQSFSSPSSLASVAASAGFNQASSSAHGHTCSRGPHVWKTDNVKVLHAYEPFRSIAAIRAEMTETDSQHTWSRTQDVVALDAELIFTTAGMSIVRITLVDESGEVLVDQLIKPSAPAIDYNTRFSGVSAADFEADAATEIFPSLGAAQMAVAEFVGPKTVLIGHGLENDLRAMRLVHDRVADTALLFPHSKGLPMRLSLRELAKRHLGILIQIAGAAGHSSLEDARVAQEIVRWKLVEDPHSSPFRERKPSAAGSTTSPIHPGPESPALAIHSPSTPLTGDFGQYLRPPPSPSLSGPDGGAGPSDSHNQGQASGQTLPLARTRPAPPPPRVNPRAAASLFVPKKRPPPS